MFQRIYTHCQGFKGVTEGFPFGEDTLVLKVGGKIFALVNLTALPMSINLKCDPERAVELRESMPSILPGYHMNKRHWNTCVLDGSISDDLLYDLIDHSYKLVHSSLPKKTRIQIDREHLEGVGKVG